MLQWRLFIQQYDAGKYGIGIRWQSGGETKSPIICVGRLLEQFIKLSWNYVCFNLWSDL